jgi:transcriptional regulator with XRE-family HTH domain
MKIEDLAAVGKRVRVVRKALRLQQKEMSAGIGISNSHLSEIEKGESNPTASFFLNLSQKYNISVEYLFHGRGEMFYGKEEKNRTKKIKFEGDIGSIEKLVWLMENSIYFKNSILGIASRFKMENDDYIELSIKKNMSLKEDPDSQNV